MASGDVVRLKNIGETDFKDSFNARPYVIPAHGELMVDFDAMSLWLGHPEANNFDPRNRVRVMEFQRLRIRYGVEAKALELSIERTPFDEMELFHSMKPPLEAYDMADKRILTVCDDPDGDFLTTPAPESTSDIGLLMARIQAMEQEQSNLRHQLAMRQRSEQATNEAQPIPTDIAGTIPEASPSKAPEPPPRTATTEDTPSRIRVTST